MDVSKCRFLCLPLELRQQIYEMYFEESPTPSILCVNRQVHDESMQFLRKYQQTFSYNISGSGAGFDNFSHWCFRIKGHIPELSKMKHIILNIHPPDQDRPIEMLHIWTHLRVFCKELATQCRISQLTVKFIEIDNAGWATNGVPHTTMELNYEYDKEDFFGEDVGQILVTLHHFVGNVEKPRVILPCSHRNDLAQAYADHAEKLMTGLLEDEDEFDEYKWLEDCIKWETSKIKRATGRKSKALFERKYGQNVVLQQDQLDDLKRQWPHMDDLWHWERPRFRVPSPTYDCACVRSYVQVSMPDPAWRPEDRRVANAWHEDRLDIIFHGKCHYYQDDSGYIWKPFMLGSHSHSFQEQHPILVCNRLTYRELSFLGTNKHY